MFLFMFLIENIHKIGLKYNNLDELLLTLQVRES